ncbi:DUF2721 domain-containing protein [Anaeromyxobacter oryzisoli]|jgi:uncharacterized protein DUF2721|uniref:DUF2721 domain-containing protein n=1 Tax=Anaeromyxobacter oryzisoli TaxID=2925408 RepID=UPI001F56104D|nr:DUF2721 domain-containing protein [Anaeromyxobacter sp. SG63]
MNAIQQIGAAVTPAVMVSACGLIALGLDNQAARMSARLRELAREWRELPADTARRALVRSQIEVLDRRHGLYSRALLLNYGALFAFVVTSLAWLAQGLWSVPPGFPLATFAFGVAMLAAMAVLVIASVNLSRTALQAEAAEILRGAVPPAGERAAALGR